MKIDICYFIETDKVPAGAKRQRPSKGFDKAWKSQVFDKIVPTLEHMFPIDSIKICQTKMMSFSQENDDIVGVIRHNDVLLDGFLSLFDFDIFWKNAGDGSKVLPTDKISEDHLVFWIERFPSEREIAEMRNRFDHLIQIVIDRKKRKDKKYRFSLKIREVSEILKFTMRTRDPETEEIINSSVDGWNRIHPDRLIHNFYLTEKEKGSISYLFNWGSATEETMDFIMDKLDNSPLNISTIAVTSAGLY